MLASQWTSEIIVISVVLTIASAMIGYFVAALRQVSMLLAQQSSQEELGCPALMSKFLKKRSTSHAYW